MKPSNAGNFRRVINAIRISIIVVMLLQTHAAAFGQQSSFLRQLKDQAGRLGSTYGETDSAPLEPVQTYSQLALSFLSAAEILDPVAPRTVYRRKMPKVTVSPDAFQKLSDEEQKAFTAFQCDESTYYGHYSTPLAWGASFRPTWQARIEVV